MADTKPEDYGYPDQFFKRTYLTRAFRKNAGMVLRQLKRKSETTAPALTIITYSDEIKYRCFIQEPSSGA